MGNVKQMSIFCLDVGGLARLNSTVLLTVAIVHDEDARGKRYDNVNNKIKTSSPSV